MLAPGRRRLTALGLTALTALLGACAGSYAHDSANGQDFALIDRGRYLTILADCTACHSDPTHSNGPFGGGRPVATPFGTLVAPNITPDPQTGIGGWTEQQFDDAVRRGRLPNGQRLYPAMPFPYFAKMSAAEVRAIHAYLSTVKPVRHHVVANELPFPLSIRASLIFWDWLYYRPGAWQPQPERSAAWNRGAYLVEGPGHCGACHTSKTLLGGDRNDRFLQGYSLQGWFAPNLTTDARSGLAAWSTRDTVEYLANGHNRFAAASGPMAEVVADSSSHMTRGDLEAIATYLQGQRSTSEPRAPLPASDPAMQAGAAIYRDQCSACHKIDGTGLPYLIPNLAGSASVASREPTSVLQVILRGGQSVATRKEPTGPQMPSYAWQLDDAQVAAVATFIRNSWGHATSAVTESTVREARERLAQKQNSTAH